MDIRKALSDEHSRVQTDRIVRYIGSDPKRFAGLMAVFFKGDARLTQRAAWPMSYCVRKHPALANPYYKKWINKLQEPGVHPGVTRNIVRLLQDTDIPTRYHGQVMNTCFHLITAVETPAAIKAFSLTILDHLAVIYPDIRPELKLIIETQWHQEKPAFRSRAKKVLQNLKK